MAKALDVATAELVQAQADLSQTLMDAAQNPSDPFLTAQKEAQLAVLIGKQGQVLGYQQQIQVLGATYILPTMGLNNSVNAVAIHEKNEKAVNAIVLNQASSGGADLGEASLESLRAIANQCPHIGGSAVDWAMILLPTCEQIPLHKAHDDCTVGKPRTADSTVDATVTLSPNPAHDYIDFQVSEPSFRLQVFDLSGRLWHSSTSVSAPYRLSISAFPIGIYYYRIESENTLPLTGKLIKQ